MFLIHWAEKQQHSLNSEQLQFARMLRCTRDVVCVAAVSSSQLTFPSSQMLLDCSATSSLSSAGDKNHQHHNQTHVQTAHSVFKNMT